MRAKRSGPGQVPAVTDAERLWAEGQLTHDHAGYPEMFFWRPRRLRYVFAEVNGVTVAEWFERHPDRVHGGHLLLNGAIVAWVEESELDGFKATGRLRLSQ